MADPVLIAYSARRRGSGCSHWQRIGHAYPHEQGAGLTLVLDVIPLDGRIVLLEPDENDDRRLASRAAQLASAFKARRR